MGKPTDPTDVDAAWIQLESVVADLIEGWDHLGKLCAVLGVAPTEIVADVVGGRAGDLAPDSPGHRRVHRLITKHGAKCRWCKAPLWCPCSPLLPQAFVVLLKPESRGGGFNDANMRLGCGLCLDAKGELTIAEWRVRS